MKCSYLNPTRLRSLARRLMQPSYPILIIAAAVLFVLYLINRQEGDGAEAVVQTDSYYTLTIDGVPAIYFASIDNDTTLSGGTVSKDSVATHRERHRAYWVNQLSLLPSCFGRLLIAHDPQPSNAINYGSERLHRMLDDLYIRIDKQLAGWESQSNELRYYLRVHSVKDYGYNNIAEYSQYVSRQIDSLHNLSAAIGCIRDSQRLALDYTTIYRTRTDTLVRCHPLRSYNHGFRLIQTYNHLTPARVHTPIDLSKARKELSRLGAFMPRRGRLPITLAQPKGSYYGETKGGKPDGYGKLYGADGSYYSGHWTNGKLNGYGFFCAPHAYLQAGTWKNGVFKGEQLTYTADRIYGIDVSRHQHEQGGKIYPITWSKLRIVGLGSLSAKKIRGKVDYPVSFVYIKATEGTTVTSKYYHADYLAAREAGLRVGSYHFLSTTSPALQQAAHFLNVCHIGKGDLPPVLDVEPSDAQIKAMGGIEKLWGSMRTWLSTVHQRTGLRPILYTNQLFINKYLDLAPDIEDNYLVWIARYGQYKPNVKLIYWQLSPDGRVKGVHGDVDINVFNGYRNQYGDFLTRHAKK